MSSSASQSKSSPKNSVAVDMQLARKSLLEWYSDSARDLPWRQTRDAYRIWISEIMLQQTQVATVIDYYRRFLKRFPDVRALAIAEEPEVLQLWSGLGYYRRARQLHEAAKRIVEDFDGKFPKRFEDILGLPGIGRYTAGAIASFAYDQPKPILEANTLRLLSRLIGLRDDPRGKNGQQLLWDFAEQWVQLDNAASPDTTAGGNRRSTDVTSSPSAINQALMEVGALVCKPQDPQCTTCPLAEICRAYEEGLQNEIPLKATKQKFIPVDHALAIVRHRGKMLFRQNEKGQWWEGLWDYPRLELDPSTAKLVTRSDPTAKHGDLLSEHFQTTFALDLEFGASVRTIKHGVTKYRISLHCFEAAPQETVKLGDLPGNWKWQSLATAETSLPLTSTAAKLTSWLLSQPAK